MSRDRSSAATSSHAQPAASIGSEAAHSLSLSEVTVATTAAHLEALGVVREATGRRRNKLFVYSKYLAVLEEGTAVA